MKKVVMCLIFLLCLLVGSNVFSIEISDTEKQMERKREAVWETAQAMLRQGEQIQYDRYRKNLYASPEDATSQHYVYTVCAGFTFQTYYQAMGIQIPDEVANLIKYAKNHYENGERNNAIFYFGETDCDEYFTNKEDFKQLMKANAKPGDIFVVTRTCYVNRGG